MKEFLFPFFGLQFYVAATVDNNPLWERLLEKWGIGFIGIALLYFLAKWTSKREDEARTKQSKREDEARTKQSKREEEVRDSLIAVDKERADRELASNHERAGLLKRNNELQEEQIRNMLAHSVKLEQLTRDGTKAITDSGSAMRMLIRKMQRPCVAPFLPSEQEDNPEDAEA